MRAAYPAHPRARSLKALMDARTGGAGQYGGGGSGSGSPGGGGIDPMREIIVLAACGANELLPQVREGFLPRWLHSSGSSTRPGQHIGTAALVGSCSQELQQHGATAPRAGANKCQALG